MAPKWLLLMASVALTGSTLCAYFAWPKSEERLVAPKPVYDFGELGQGEKVTARIELVNNGSDTVRIVQILKNCDCATVSFDNWELAPKERTTATAVWETGAKRNRTSTDIGVVYASEKGGLRRTALRLEANVIPDIRVSSERLEFRAQVKSTNRLVCSPGRLSEFSIVRAYCTQRAFAAEIVPGTSEVEVAFDPEQWPEEAIPAYLKVETTSKHEPCLQIELTVKGD